MINGIGTWLITTLTLHFGKLKAPLSIFSNENLRPCRSQLKHTNKWPSADWLKGSDRCDHGLGASPDHGSNSAESWCRPRHIVEERVELETVRVVLGGFANTSLVPENKRPASNQARSIDSFPAALLTVPEGFRELQQSGPLRCICMDWQSILAPLLIQLGCFNL